MCIRDSRPRERLVRLGPRALLDTELIELLIGTGTKGSPSPADRAVTRQLAEAGRVVGVELLDHVVIGRPESDPAGKGWFSFGEAGLI